MFGLGLQGLQVRAVASEFLIRQSSWGNKRVKLIVCEKLFGLDVKP